MKALKSIAAVQLAMAWRTMEKSERLISELAAKAKHESGYLMSFKVETLDGIQNLLIEEHEKETLTELFQDVVKAVESRMKETKHQMHTGHAYPMTEQRAVNYEVEPVAVYFTNGQYFVKDNGIDKWYETSVLLCYDWYIMPDQAFTDCWRKGYCTRDESVRELSKQFESVA